MKALSLIGQMRIDFDRIQRINNRECALSLIWQSITDIRNGDTEKAKEKIITAYELIFESCHLAFVVVSGLTPLVLNEQLDAQNHNKLDEISNQLYCCVCELCKLSPITQNYPNIISHHELQVRRLTKHLLAILHGLKDTN